jgi:predicted PurR-regulated permease PerM
MDFLDRLRARPESYRRRVAVLTAFAITAVIFLVWVSTLLLGLDSSTQVVQQPQEGPSALSRVQAELTNLFLGVQERIDEIEGVFGPLEYDASEEAEGL